MRRLKQSGFNLIEVMIALVVVSIGLLGMAILQMTSLQQNQSAYHRSQATLLAYDITDRMRANMDEVDAGSYFAANGALTGGCISYTGTAAGCTQAEMAAHDIAEWQASLATELPQGGGRVCRSDVDPNLVVLDAEIANPPCAANNSNNPVVVYVWWNDEKSASGATTQFSVSAEL
ncbi:type IV pilus modification protein PilV [Neptuniibacter pectenicola]|uniref:Type IV pilus modification protein PilV n=1 Tax=Neptuniibacter pectenicola TaxID=1806669 RepID=A0ABU9TU02_9GAMM